MKGCRLSFALFCVVIVISLFTSCTKKPAAPEHRYEITGKIVAVDRNVHEITIAHQDIPGFMKAMTMPFRVKDDWVFDAAAPGDQISATLVVGDDSHLENVAVTKQGPDTGSTPGVRLPQPGDSVPALKFVNQDGKQISLADFRGKALLLTFIYTRCPLPDYCIRMSNNFGKVAQSLKKNQTLYGKTELLSISFDPEYDTPRVLREYGRTYAGEIDPNFTHWQFATGTHAEVKKAADYFGISYTKDNGQFVHSLRTALIGPDGKIVQLYPGNDWKPEEAVQALSAIRF